MTETTPSSLWTDCPTVLGKALMGAFGFEMLDLGVLLGLLFGGFLLRPLVGLHPVIPLVVTILAGIGMWVGKRGKPRGAIIHWLHEWDFLPLPGILPPVEQHYHQWS